MTDEFDPTTVPPFPVITLELRDDDTVVVDGHPVDIGLDEVPTAAGIRAVAHRAAAHGLKAVRVRATSPDGTHFMVVTEQGDAYPLGVASDPQAKATRPRRALAIGLSIAILAVVGVGVGVTTFAIANVKTEPVASPSPTPPGAGANLPVPAPPGFATAATWAVDVKDSITPVLVDADRIALVDASGGLSVLNTATGRPVWKGSGRVSEQDGIHVTAIGDTPVLASAGSTSISLWPLEEAGQTVAPTTVKTGSRAEISYLGSAPLVDLGSQTIGLIDSTGLTRIDVPVTATPIMATTDGAIAANGLLWWNLSVDQEPLGHPMPRPAGAGAQPTLISAADNHHLIVIWPTETASTDVVSIVNLSSNTIVATATVPIRAADARDLPLHSPTSDTLVLGALYVDYGSAARIVPLEDVKASAVNGATIYGTQDSVPVVAEFDGEAFTVMPFTEVDVDDTSGPVAVTGQQAFMIAQKVENTFLYALSREG